MSGGDWINKAFGGTDKVTDVRDELVSLSNAFHLTGNDVVAKGLV